MKEVLIIPGYGDRQDYIEFITRKWPKRYGLNPTLFSFHTANASSKNAEDIYSRNWYMFSKLVRQVGKVSVIGLSFGVSIADRSLIELPEVNNIVCIGGPHRLEDMNLHTVKTKYPMLEHSLSGFQVDDLPTERIMTITPFTDGTVNPEVAQLEGAKNLKVPVFGHPVGLAAGLFLRASNIAEFINN